MNCYDCGKEIEVTPLTVTVRDSNGNITGYQCNKCWNKMIRGSKRKDDDEL